MNAVRLITIEESQLRDLIREEATKAMALVLSSQNDELLTITQLCEKIPGLTRYLFSNLLKSSRLKCVRGKYSLKAVKAAMQSR